MTDNTLHDGYRALLDAQLDGQRELPAWAGDLRRQALARFEQVGFPHRKHEDWKYTRVGDLARTVLAPVEPGSAEVLDALEAARAPGATTFVLVDGRFRPDLSRGLDLLPNGTLRPLGEALVQDGEALSALMAGDATSENAFAALAAAFAADGAVVHVPADTELGRPIQVIHLSTGVQADDTPRMMPLRLLVSLERHARATLIESFVGDAGPAGVVNHAARVRVAEGARLDHVRIQAEGSETRIFSHVEVDVQRDGTWRSLVLSTGARLAREDLRVSLNGTGAHADLAALTLARDKQHIDHNTLLEHRVPHCTSDQLYKNAITGAGRAIFHGKIHVFPDAQKTEAYQLNRNLLLSEDARVDTRPQLEIFADDVKCSHGATIGRLQEDELFYLTSRGIGPETASRLLVRGFVLDVLERVEDPGLRAWLEARLDNALERLLTPA